MALRVAGREAFLRRRPEDKRQVYDLLIRQLAQQSEPRVQELFRLMELSRARTLQDQKSASVTLANIQKQLAPDALLPEYWVGDESLAVLWANANEAGVVYRSVGAGLRARLGALSSGLKDAARDWKPSADRIAHDLLDGVGRAPGEPGGTKAGDPSSP